MTACRSAIDRETHRDPYERFLSRSPAQPRPDSGLTGTDGECCDWPTNRRDPTTTTRTVFDTSFHSTPTTKDENY
ncbi:hypothetical protein D8S78_17795 [Natrialba swarupiae]|nr:hypothetical protein [Natrialba swarupiae]